jgi:hypothetical protein
MSILSTGNPSSGEGRSEVLREEPRTQARERAQLGWYGQIAVRSAELAAVTSAELSPVRSAELARVR